MQPVLGTFDLQGASGCADVTSFLPALAGPQRTCDCSSFRNHQNLGPSLSLVHQWVMLPNLPKHPENQSAVLKGPEPPTPHTSPHLQGAVERGAKRIRVHVLTDGRDVPDGSSLQFIQQLVGTLGITGTQCVYGWLALLLGVLGGLMQSGRCCAPAALP